MKIQFIKDHGSNHEGLVIECGRTRGIRFIEAGVAIDCDNSIRAEEIQAHSDVPETPTNKVEEKEVKIEAETKELKTGNFLNKVFGKK